MPTSCVLPGVRPDKPRATRGPALASVSQIPFPCPVPSWVTTRNAVMLALSPGSGNISRDWWSPASHHTTPHHTTPSTPTCLLFATALLCICFHAALIMSALVVQMLATNVMNVHHHHNHHHPGYNPLTCNFRHVHKVTIARQPMQGLSRAHACQEIIEIFKRL